MAAKVSPDVRDRLRACGKPWRMAFIMYALALSVGTHWPNLQLAPEIPATDKTIHLLAFAGLTLLLRLTRWLKQLWLVALTAVAWAAIDEFSQGIPILNRTVSHHDVIANVLGVAVAVAWLWALMPVGVPGGGNQMRLRLGSFVFDEMFSRWPAWRTAIVGATAGGLPLLALWPVMSVPAARVAIVLAIALSGVVTLTLWRRQWKAHMQRVMATRPCLACGAIQRPSAPICEGEAMRCEHCERCGATIAPLQWSAVRAVPLNAMIRSGRRPFALAAGALLAAFGLILALPIAYEAILKSRPGGASAPRLARFIGTVPPELMNAVDLAAILLLLAVAVRVYRAGIARFHDQAMICARCGHDLRATPTVDGQGTCGECGARFLRLIGSTTRSKADEHG